MNWDQVARLQQLCAYDSARASFGVAAFCKTHTGRPQLICRHFPTYLSRSFQSRFGAVFTKQEPFLTSLLHDKGRLLYYVQAVNLVHLSEFTNVKPILHEILGLTNMASKTGNLMSFLPLHLGLKVKVTKKLLPPEILQKCLAEVVAIQFRPNERFGVPGAPAGGGVPAGLRGQMCWETGYVRLDYISLPRLPCVLRLGSTAI